MNSPKRPLIMWVVYEKPADFPDEYVARKFINGHATEIKLQYKDLHQLHVMVALNNFGMKFYPRANKDEPQILGMWM